MAAKSKPRSTPKKKTPAAKSKAAAKTPRFTGGCCCGAVRYVVEAPLQNVFSCHCSKCRRWHGHFGAYAMAPRGAVHFTERSGLRWFDVSPQAQRGFCDRCGSSLFFSGTGDGSLGVCVGGLDSTEGLRTIGHLFVGSKGAYYELGEDGALRFEAYPE